YVRSESLTVETASGIKHLRLFIREGKVSSVSVDMGKADFSAASVPLIDERSEVIDAPITIGGREYTATCLSVGNGHCVVFTDNIDKLDLASIGPEFEYAPCFPERVNTEFVRVVNPTTLRMRVWERGSGETLSCGTGACAAAAAAVKLGLCAKNRDIKVNLLGGDMTVNVSDTSVTLTGSAVMVFEGEFEY
ncbi:MAG: diaminopimelate epimerase, partial [Clostridia bacterium]|nr:diaminopimelate epimerase [Clostridia bacterium]